MERDEASADAVLLGLAFSHVLPDVHLEFDVELAAVTHLFLEVLAVDDVVDRRPEAGAKKSILHVLADHDVVTAAFSEEIHARGHFGVPKECRTGHRVVPVAVEPSEREYRGEGVLVQAAKADTRTKCVGQPDQGADLVPERISGTESAQPCFQSLEDAALTTHGRAAGQDVVL